jgi:type I restriction enzyme S subunit
MMEGLGFRPYEAYKDSRVDWIGSIPSTWEVQRAKWLFKRMDRGVRPEDDIVTCFRDGEVTLRSNRRTEGFTTALKEIGYQGIRKGDLVIHAMDAFAGAIGVSDSDGKATPVYSACVPRQPDTVDPTFYAYYMRHLALSGFLVSLAKGIRERSTDFRFNDFAELEVPLPSLAEQRAIVAFLDEKCAKADGAVKIKEDQIALLRERRQIIIQEAVTRGLNPAAPMKDSGIDWIGQIPAHWDLQPMRAFFRFRNEKNDPVKTENILSLSIAHGVTPYSEEGRGGNKRKDDLTAYKLAYPGDIVLNSMNVIVGAVGRSKYFGAISPVYYAFYPVGDHVYVPFYEQIFLNAGFQRGLLRLGKGILIKLSGTGQLNTIRMKISTDDLKGLLFPTPPQNEQHEIVEYISQQNVKIENGIAIKERQIAALKEYKTSLINAAVTGKIKVI